MVITCFHSLNIIPVWGTACNDMIMCCIFLDISFKEACLLISLRPKIKTKNKKIPLSGIHNSQKKERKKEI